MIEKGSSTSTMTIPLDHGTTSVRRRGSVLKKVLIALAVIVIAFVAFVAAQPSVFRVSRATTINATAGVVFAQVNDFHNWTWNPWGQIDPAMRQTYEGAPAGKGAVYAWSGNNEVGEGRMTIIESHPNDLVKVRLDFVKPFAGTSIAEFTFAPKGEQTAVVWSMVGENNFIAKAIHLFLDMDKMIGDQFDKGLAQLKSTAESAAKQ